ncbi:hypothetical protein PR003_g33492 [Phytophthora rubi]|uniref:Uncharacterized protein n=1 Tax=Phytophthora rubi TaxID=129364 RepID=A0A6A3G6N6_9STRA|nr:hypothetical protein PR002_g32203 [Phytophthora rubi]KAE8954204.1 hypothetical protein PR001_g32589 [Phytophthora rubi]KAE9262570.1 hypothetical protein PR003_g33492 [Phytophthora rubi]
MASALADGKLQLPTSKQCPTSVADAGDGVRARGWQAATAHQQVAWLLVTCMAEMEVLTIAMYIYGYDSCSSVRLAWPMLVMVSALADGKLPSPSRRFMTPEVAGRRCCY